MKTNYKVGDRVAVAAGEGVITSIVTERGCYRVRLDDGRVQTVDETGVTAAKKKDEKADHKMVEGPARAGTRY